MPRRVKVYLPRWVPRLMIPFLVLLWLFASWSAFFTRSGRVEMGTVEWILMTVMFLLIGVMMWLMGSGKLAAYEIEMDDRDDTPKT